VRAGFAAINGSKKEKRGAYAGGIAYLGLMAISMLNRFAYECLKEGAANTTQGAAGFVAD